MRSSEWKWPLILVEMADEYKRKQFAADTAEIQIAEAISGIAECSNFLDSYLALLVELQHWDKIGRGGELAALLARKGQGALDAVKENIDLFNLAAEKCRMMTNVVRQGKKLTVWRQCQRHFQNWKIAFADGGEMLAAAIRVDAALWKEHGPMTVADAVAILQKQEAPWPKDLEGILLWYFETIRVKCRRDFKLQPDEGGMVGKRCAELGCTGRFEALFEGIPMWQGNAACGLRVPIGWTPDGQRMFFELDTDGAAGMTSHALVGGATGSGKSVLVHNIIHSMAHVYGPDGLEILFFDFKGGVEVGRYADERGKIWLPHIANARYGLSPVPDAIAFCETLAALIARERARLGNAGGINIRQYAAQGGRMKRTVVVVEDFQELFLQNAAHGALAWMTLRSALKQGRALGLHLLLTTQTMSWARNALGGAVEECLSWIGLRFALFGTCSDGILAGDNQRAVSTIRPRQEAVMNTDFGKIGANTVFHFPFVERDSEEEKCFLRRIEEKTVEG